MKSLRNKMLEPHQSCHSSVYNDNKNDKIYWDLIAFVAQPINSYMWQIKDRILGK
jgi:hypothetical protein